MFNIKKIMNIFPLQELAQSMVTRAWWYHSKIVDYVSIYQTCNDMFNIKKIVKMTGTNDGLLCMIVLHKAIWLCNCYSHLAYFVKYQGICGPILTSRSGTIDGYSTWWYYQRQLNYVSIYQTYNVMFNIKKFVKKIHTSRTTTIDGLLCTWLCYIKQFDCASVSHNWRALLNINIFVDIFYNMIWNNQWLPAMMKLSKATGLCKYLSDL